MKALDDHRSAARRSLAFPAAVAARLDEALIADARARLERWAAQGLIADPYARQWTELLGLPPDELRAALVAEGEALDAARQCTPFAGALSNEERWRIVREVR